MFRGSLVSITAAIAALAISAAAAPAAVVTVGSQLVGNFRNVFHCPSSCVLSQTDLTGATLTAPFDGVIVRWHMVGAAPAHSYRLQALSPVGGLEFLGVRSTAEVSPAGSGLETFAAALPIAAGQSIGLNMDVEGEIGFRQPSDALALAFIPALADGAQAQGIVVATTEAAFNAEIQPRPAIAEVSSLSGPMEGGNSVVITGSGFENVSAVSFGVDPAKSYAVDSEGQITAIAPAVAEPVTVPISVTTLAGTATSEAEYVYEFSLPERERKGQPPTTGGEGQPCRVPEIRGERLKAAKKGLRRAHCRIGRVKRKLGATAKTGKVVGQRPKPGKTLRSGAKVSVTLGPVSGRGGR
jgi:hypothetical protein